MSLIWMEKDVGFPLNMRGSCPPFASLVEKLDMMKSIVGWRLRSNLWNDNMESR